MLLDNWLNTLRSQSRSRRLRSRARRGWVRRHTWPLAAGVERLEDRTLLCTLIAHDDSAAAREDFAIDIPVMANDEDGTNFGAWVDGVDTTGTLGTVEIVGGSDVNYTPPSGFSGTDSFQYTIVGQCGPVDDPTPISDTAAVTVTVEATPRVIVTASDSGASEPGTDTGEFTVSRTGSTASSLFVYFTVGGTATPDMDYASFGDSVEIPAGSADVTIAVTPFGDSVVEGDETVTVDLSDGWPDYVIDSPSTATVTIADDDTGDAVTTVTITATDGAASEEGPDPGEFTVSRSTLGDALTVNYTIGGTATNGSDYGSLSGSVTIPTGASSAPINVTPTDDEYQEPSETVVLTLSEGGYTIGSLSSATVTISDDNDTTPLPTVTITATDDQGAEAGPDPGRFTVTRSGSTSAALTVHYSIGGTATNGNDYSSLSSSVTIAAGAASAVIDVTPIDDSTIEDAESVVLTLSSGQYTIGTPSTATVTITSDDLPVVTVNTVDGWGFEADGDTAAFRISRTGPTTNPLSVSYTNGGTATSGDDYTALPGTVTVPSGASSVMVSVAPVDDLLVEPDETVSVILSSGSGYTIGSPSLAIANIVDNDSVVTVSATDPTAHEQGLQTGQFTVSRSGNTDGWLTVSFGISGTATSGSDYTALGGSVGIPAGESSATVTVTPIDDSEAEGDETVVLTIVNDARYTVGSPSSDSVTIHSDDQPTVTITASDPDAWEADLNLGQFSVSRTGPTTDPLTVNYTIGGTAMNGTDYASLSGSVTIAAGASWATIDVTPSDDSVAEPNETVVLTVSAGSGYVVGSPSNAIVTIYDNDSVVTITASDPEAGEAGPNPGQFTVSRSGDTSESLTVAYSIGGTATAGSDYSSLLTTATIAAGATSVAINVNPIDDTAIEDPETVVLTLSSGNRYTLGSPSTATVTIASDDFQTVTISASDPDAWEADLDPGQFSVSRTGPTTDPLTVNYTIGGTATNGTDYSSLSGSVTIAAGASSGTIAVTPSDDAVAEPNETVVLTVSAGSGYVVGSPSDATVTIYDNDSVVTITASDPEAGEAGSNPGQFTVTRSGDTSSALVVSYAVSGTATAGDDYQTLSGSVTIPVGALSAPIQVTPTDDTIVESSETVLLTLSSASGYGVGTPSNATVTIFDNDGNTPPFADADWYTIGHDTTLTIAAPGVLGNDWDDDFDPITAILDSGPALGTLNYFNSDGSFEYVPPAQWAGTVTFTYHISDGLADSNLATVTIDVLNQAPAAVTDSYSSGHNTTLTVAAPGVLGNDWDDDFDPITAILDSGPTGGTLNYLNSDGSFEYVPNSGFSGADSFTYHVNDGLENRTLATVTINVDQGGGLPIVSIAAGDASAAETRAGQALDTATFVVTRDAEDLSQALSVSLGIHTPDPVPGNLADQSDYTTEPSGLTVTIPAGEASVTITITAVDDEISEPTEVLWYEVLEGEGYTVPVFEDGSGGTAWISIGDNDGLWSTNADFDTSGEGPSSHGDCTFCVEDLTGAVTFNYFMMLGLGSGGGYLPTYDSGYVDQPVGTRSTYIPVNAAGETPVEIEAVLTIGGVPQPPVTYTVDPALGGSIVWMALSAGTAALGTGRHEYSIATTYHWPDLSTTQDSFSSVLDVVDGSGTDSPFAALGPGWRLPVLDRLVFDAGGALLVRGDGTAGYFRNDAGAWISPPGTRGTLEEPGDGTLVFHRYRGGRDVFNATTGLLLRRFDRNVSQTTFTYIDADADGETDDISEIVDGFGETVTYAYAGGFLSSMTDDHGLTFEFARAAGGRPSTITGPDADGAGPLGQPQITFTWNGDLLASVTDPIGRITQISYGAGGWVQSVARPGGITWLIQPIAEQGLDNLAPADAAPAEFTDPNGADWQTSTDRFGYATATADLLGRTSSIPRDGHGMPIAQGKQGVQTTFLRDSQGRLTRVTHPDGTFREFTYDTASLPDNPTSLTDELGRTWLFSYDLKGNLLSTRDPLGGLTSFTYTPKGLMATMTLADPDGSVGPRPAPVYSWLYDEHGQLIQQTNPDQTTRTYVWNAAHRLASETDELGRSTSYAWSPYGQLVSLTLPDPDGPSGGLTSPSWTWVRDLVGREIEEYDPGASLTLFDWDDRDRLVAVTLPDPGGPSDPLGNPVWRFTYDPNGNLLSESDPLGNVTWFGYDIANRPTQTTLPDPDGTGSLGAPVWRTVYDDWDRVVQTLDPLLRNTDYAYYDWTTPPSGGEANGGRLHTITLADPDLAGPAARPVWTFTWDAVGNRLSESDPLSRRTDFQFDALDRLTTVTLNDPDGVGVGQPRPVYETVYDALGNVLIARDALGNETSFAYDIMSRVSSRTDADPDGEGLLGSPVTAFGYDLVGNLTDVTDALSRTVTTTYDNLNRPIQRTLAYPSGQGPGAVPVWSWTYDVRSNVRSETNPNGETVDHVYDRLSRRVETWLPDPDGAGDLARPVYTWTYDSAGRVLLSTTPSVTAGGDGPLTTYTYDDLGRLTQMMLPDPDGAGGDPNSVYGWTYDAMSNVLTEVDALGAVTEHTYDRLDRRVETVLSDPDGAGPLTSPTYSWNFDAGSQLVASTDPLGRRVDYVRDGLGRVIEVQGVDPDGPGPETRPTWQTEYDLAGNVLVERDPLGHERSHSYDNLYRRIQTTLEDSDGAGPAVSPTIAYTWDVVSNLLSLRDPENNVTSWTYDDQNRPVRETNELGHSRLVAYDNVGRVLETTDRNGRVVAFTRDALGRVTEERWLEGQTLVNTIASDYDGAGRLTDISDAFSTYHYLYDGLNRVTFWDNSGTPDAPLVTFTSTYDAAGRRASVIASLDGTKDHGNTYTRDALGRITRIEQIDETPGSNYSVGDKRVDIAYLADGRFDMIRRYEDLAGTELVAQSAYGYDDAGRLISLDHTQDLSTLASYDWALDAAGRISEATSLADGTVTYSYDNNDQLTEADYSAAGFTDETHAWDANGNPSGAEYTVTGNNLLVSDGTYDYAYDNEGNRTRRTMIATGEYVEYDWDHRNRLTDVVFKTAAGATSKHVRYTYDVWNRLIRRELDSGGNGIFESAESFVYDGSDLVLVFDETGSLTHRFLPDPATDAVFADEDALGDILWYLGDNLGSVRDVADHDPSTGETTVVNHLTYSSFGAITAQLDPTNRPFVAYTGMYVDPDTGHQLHGLRWYDVDARRWLSGDPSGLGPDSNPYRYVGNSPPNFVDPTGRDAEPNPTGATQDGGTFDLSQIHPPGPWSPINASDLLALGAAIGPGVELTNTGGFSPLQLALIQQGQQNAASAVPSNLASELNPDVYRYLPAGAYVDEFGVHQSFCMSCHDRTNPASVLKMNVAGETLTTWECFFIQEGISAAAGVAIGGATSGGSRVGRVGRLGSRASGFGSVADNGLELTDDCLARYLHKNRASYVGDTHVYAIKGPKGTHKIGQSARGVRVRDGASIRGERQARELTRQTGDFYRSDICKVFPNKRAALDYERHVIERFRRMFGDDALPGNRCNR